MRCQLSALCDAANLSAEGKLNILGEFDTVYAATLPAVWPVMVFLAKIKIGEADIGSHDVHLRVLDEDMNLVAQLKGVVQIPSLSYPGIENGWPLLLHVANAAFANYGT